VLDDLTLGHAVDCPAIGNLTLAVQHERLRHMRCAHCACDGHRAVSHDGELEAQLLGMRTDALQRLVRFGIDAVERHAARVVGLVQAVQAGRVAGQRVDSVMNTTAFALRRSLRRTVLPSVVVHCSVVGAVVGCQPAHSNSPLKHKVAMLHRIIAITAHTIPYG